MESEEALSGSQIGLAFQITAGSSDCIGSDAGLDGVLHYRELILFI